MSSNKYWEMWVERKKTLNSANRESSVEKSPTPLFTQNSNNVEKT